MIDLKSGLAVFGLIRVGLLKLPKSTELSYLYSDIKTNYHVWLMSLLKKITGKTIWVGSSDFSVKDNKYLAYTTTI